MKHKSLICFMILILLLSGCGAERNSSQIVASTLPVYELTVMLCNGTDLKVSRLISESISCLHDYSLNVNQVRAVESAELVILNGAGLEDFMSDLIADKPCVDSSAGIQLLCGSAHSHTHDGHDHHHDVDPHIWLCPENAMIMSENICAALCAQYPQYKELFQVNLASVTNTLTDLLEYGQQELSSLNCRELITFHDGFAYFADAFDLTILKAVEEESGSEASAADLKELIGLVRTHDLPAIFVEAVGSTAAAQTISSETGAEIFILDMGMHGESYIEAMYHNISTIKGALG